MFVKVSTSIDDGISFSPPLRFEDVSSYPLDPIFIGDYNGMVSTSESLTIPIWADSRNSNFDIYTAPGDITVVSTSIVTNWQTLSVPLSITDYTKTTVWPTAISDAFKYKCGSGYEAQDILENGLGYYIKFGSDQTVSLAGASLDRIMIPVCAGWNIIGSITNDIPISTNICLFPPSNSFQSPFYIYRNGYLQVDHIEPGLGHWIKVEAEGSILLDKDPVYCDSREYFEEENFDHFIVSDSLGKQQDLYVANLNLYPSLEEIDFSMPPPLPEVGFDARFATGEYIRPVLPDSEGVEIIINVETASYPITLSWELNPENGIEYSFIDDSSFNKVTQITVMNGRSRFNKNSNGKIRLFGRSNYNILSKQIPNKFELSQNFPNPFNPTTTIKFSISQEVQVNLTIYNILSEKVKDLKNEVLKPGYYEVNFDASALASGVYFYRIKATPTGGQAGDFVQSKKMILLK